MSKELKKMMAKKMVNARFRTKSKGMSHNWFHARMNKKKLPHGTRVDSPTYRYAKDKSYRDQSKEEFLEKYPEWKV